jgi:hypothetical protein
MLISLYLSILFILCGVCLLILGLAGRIRFSRLFPELLPEFFQLEYVDFVTLLTSYYNSVFILGIPLFCLGITITYGWDAFIINILIWIGFLIYTDITYRRVQKILKSKGLKLKTFHRRIKDKEFYQLERQINELKIPYRKPHEMNRDRDYRQAQKKVA